MKGYQVKRKAGWDTHGLPVELDVENSLGISKEDIGNKISVEDYNNSCKEAVMKALGTGIRGVPWKSIEVYRARGKAPEIILYGNAKSKANKLGIKRIALSISHSKNYAVASVVAE